MMLQFTHYYGHAVYIVPQRVLYVEDGGCGSRGSVANVRLDNGETVSLHDNADRVQLAIAAALSGSTR